MKNSISSGPKAKQATCWSMLLAGCFSLYSVQVNAVDVLGISTTSTTDNQFNVGDAINIICPPQNLLGAELQARCNALVGSRPIVGSGTLSDQGLTSVLGQVTSEQTAAQNTRALEMNNNQLTTLSNRISSFRSGKRDQRGAIKLSSLSYDRNGNPVSTTQLAKLDSAFNKAAAGDEEFSRLGVFVNGDIGFGDRVTTVNERGYKLDTHGATVGADYRISDHFLLGMAFSYENSRTGYLNNFGKLETDSYSGAIYGSFFTDSGFFVDGIFSGSHADYDSTRHIEYTVPGDIPINTDALGDNEGDEFNVAFTSGYNFNFGGLTVTPQVRVDYTTTQVDSLDETGGMGWALHIDDQQFESLQTAPGVQLSYAISLPWAVIMPMARAEYIHEFENNSRAISARFIQDRSRTRFNILTDNPDRDYINVSAGVSAQFAYGLSAFVNYDTVQAHNYITNHNFTGGVRMELPF